MSNKLLKKCVSICIKTFINDDEQRLNSQILEKVVKTKTEERARKKDQKVLEA